MNTTNVSTLKIHKLTQAQYDRELAAGRIDENALYLTPDEEIDLSGYATKEELNNKANSSHTHSISNVTNLQTTLDGKQATISGGASTITSSNLTANRALISNGSGKVAVSVVTSTELGYLDGVTSAIQTQLDGKSNTDHTHNYAGSSSAGGAATSANKVNSSLTVQLNGGTTEGTNKFTFNGSAAKGINITPSSIGAAASSHTHDDRYYTEAEVDTKLSGKANSSHGNHVPATETANNAKFLRNDNTWQTVTPANIGASATGHKHAATDITSGTLSSDRLPTVPVSKGGTGSTTAAGALTNLGLTATAAELNYCDGVTSNIQTQLNAKLASTDASSTYMTKSNPTGEGTLTMTGDGVFSGSVEVESLQIGGVTVNYDNTNKFLEFVFTSTTDEGTEEV